jgi:hypothetical protein
MGRAARPASLWPPSPPSTEEAAAHRSQWRQGWQRCRVRCHREDGLRPLLFPLEVWGGRLSLCQTLLMAGKLVRRGRINVLPLATLFTLWTSPHRGVFCIVDTGAAYSIFPFSSPGKQSGPCLKGTDGLHIPCWGERRLSLVFQGSRFEWPFLLAKVQFPIINVDFLRHFKLLVDPAASCLVDISYCLQFPTCAASPNQPRPRRWPLPHLQGELPWRRCTLRGLLSPLILVAARAASPTGL